jgi:apolipoprotein D and lipocalin family protein
MVATRYSILRQTGALHLGFGLLTTLVGCSSQPPLDVVDRVELDRYMGKWYEIARYPTSFQEGCVGSTAEYSLKEDGAVRVVNRCRKADKAEFDEIEGTARVVDPATNAKLKVTFFWPFSGDYWIIDLGEDYEYSVVGEPRRKYLWILSRSPEMDEGTYTAILNRLPEKGYDPSRLIRAPGPEQ